MNMREVKAIVELGLRNTRDRLTPFYKKTAWFAELFKNMKGGRESVPKPGKWNQVFPRTPHGAPPSVLCFLLLLGLLTLRTHISLVFLLVITKKECVILNNLQGNDHFWLVSELPPASQPPHPSETRRACIPPTEIELPDGWVTLSGQWLPPPILHSWTLKTLLLLKPFLLLS